MSSPTSNLSSNPFVQGLENAFTKNNLSPNFSATGSTSNGNYNVLTTPNSTKPVWLSPDGTTILDSLGNPYKSPATEAYEQSLAKQASPHPTNPLAPTTGAKTSPISAKPTSSITATGAGLVAGLAGAYLGDKAGRALGGDLGAAYGKALGDGLATAAATAAATGNPAAAAVAGSLATTASLTNSALDALTQAISAGKGLEQAKANLAKSEERYQQALATKRLSPPVPTLGQNAGLSATPVTASDLQQGVGYNVYLSGDITFVNQPPPAVFPTRNNQLFTTITGGETAEITRSGTSTAISLTITSPNGQVRSLSIGATNPIYGNLNHTLSLSYSPVGSSTPLPPVAPPFVDTANPVRTPQENSLPWLPSVDLRGSNADRLAFPPEYQKTPNAVPVPSTAPRTKPNIPTSPDPEGKKKPINDPEGKKKPQPNPNSTPVSGATPIVVTGVTTSAFSIPAVDPSTALVLGALAAGTATTTNLLNQVNNQTKPEAQQTNAKQGVCDAMQPQQCGYEGVKQATTEATNPIKDVANANNGLLSALNTLLSGFIAFAQGAFGKILNILNNTVIDRSLAVMNLAANIHNAAMLTRDVGETLGSVVDNTLSLLNLRFTNSEGVQLPFTDFIGSNFRSLLISVLGVENYTSLVLNWQKANTIYHSAMAVVNTTQSMLDPISSAVEYGMENVSKIGNSLKEDGVVSENAYPAMDETIRARRVNRFERLNDTLEGAENIASNLSSITSSAVSVKEDYKQLREDTKELRDKAKAFNDADSEARAELKAELPTEITAITLAPAPAEDEE